MKSYQNRKEVPTKYQWDLSEFYKSLSEWEEEWKKTEKEIEEIPSFKGKLKNAKDLEKFLQLDTEIGRKLDNLYCYGEMCHDTNLDQEEYLALTNKAITLISKYEVSSSFAIPEILSLPKEEFQSLIQEERLQTYRPLLEKVYKQKEHTLSEKEEQLISLLTENYESYSNISSSLINSEHQYGKVNVGSNKVTIASNNIRFLKQNPDEKVRKTVEKKFGKVIQQYEQTEASLLNYYVKNNINLAKIRNYQSPLEAYLENVQLDPEVFSSLSKIARERKDLCQKYNHLMKKALHKEVLHSYDTALPWGTLDKQYTIEEALEIIRKSLAPLEENYLKKWDVMQQLRCVDYAQYKGKRSGGYCLSTQDKHSKILLSFNGTLDDVSTIAHESGHFTHHEFISEKNPFYYRYVPTMISEVASLTNEFLLSDYLYQHGESIEEKKKGLENYIKTFHMNFFGAIMEGEIELKMYEDAAKGMTITSQYLDSLAKEQLTFYNGNTIQYGPYASQMWATRSHYYQKFYLYSYAICASIATILVSRIKSGKKEVIQKYNQFLSCGGNIKTMDILKTLEIDITKKETWIEALNYFDEQMDKYEKLRGEQK